MKKWLKGESSPRSGNLSLRINLVFFLIIIFSAAIIGKLFFIQIISNEFWQALAQGQQKFFASFQEKRGEIFFQNGKPLAINRNFAIIYALPNEIEKPEETAEVLSLILNLNKDSILEKLKKDSLYELLKNKLAEEEISNLKKINLPGIYLGVERGRYYPLESLASQVIGFLGGDDHGQYGLEGYYDDIMQGKENSDLILTLDYSLQFQAEKLLSMAKESLDIEEGQIIVINPNSGKILALASFPNFNPNQYEKYAKENNFEIFQNPAIQKTFEPGSIFKPITMAAALDQEVITPQTTYIDEGVVRIGDDVIHNFQNRVWGKKTMTEVLEWSINTGAVFAEQKVGHQLFLEYIEKLGLFEKTGIDLNGEVFSVNSEFKKGYEINFATASFGQGIEMTPIQLVRAISAIANGGKLVKPYLVDKIVVSESGKPERVIETQPEIQNDSVISQKTASQLTAMLVSAVENGYGKRVQIPGYYIAGKSGTAQIPWSALGINKPGYSEKTIQSFLGFLPAFNPQFLILVKLQNPKAVSASGSAVQVFRDLTKYIIDYYQIPPDYE